jgi:quercetin dioxygenase-like cupin family protein
MASKVRRIATEQIGGKGTIASDADAPPEFNLPGGQVVEIWRAGPRGFAQPITREWSIEPPRGGSLVRISEFIPGETDGDPWMHMTETIDYAIILEGEVVLITDTGETVVRQGDVVVQQGANHAWQNRSGKLCRMAVVMIDSGPK